MFHETLNFSQNNQKASGSQNIKRINQKNSAITQKVLKKIFLIYVICFFSLICDTIGWISGNIGAISMKGIEIRLKYTVYCHASVVQSNNNIICISICDNIEAACAERKATIAYQKNFFARG